jgi:thiol-disulfide isomerase/thioredoxin
MFFAAAILDWKKLLKSKLLVITPTKVENHCSTKSVMYKLILTFYFLFSTFYSFAQDSIVVKGRFIDNTKYAKVLMKKFAVGSFPVGAVAIKKDSFQIVIPRDIEPGVYRFQYAMAETEQYIDIIINGQEKEIYFTLKANDEQAEPHFVASAENQKWYAYRARSKAQMIKFDLLNQFINSYPNSESTVVIAAEQEWQREKDIYQKNLSAFKAEMKGSWAYDMVANRPYHFTNPREEPRIQDYMKREHFWDGFEASNPKLMNTPLYSEHILNYLRYWMNPNMNFTPEQKTEGFKRSVDLIIRKFSGNEKTQAFAYKYLTLGFKEIAEEEVLKYLDENYKGLAQQCYDEVEKSEFDKRMTGYIAMREGNTVPDFAIKDESGKLKEKSLYKVKAQQSLLVFWSTSCPHCMEEMPAINEWAGKQMDVRVIAVAVDRDTITYRNTISRFPNLIHSCDFKGWDTDAAKKYYIMATPSFILLDDKKRILKKGSTMKQFSQNLK